MKSHFLSINVLKKVLNSSFVRFLVDFGPKKNFFFEQTLSPKILYEP